MFDNHSMVLTVSLSLVLCTLVVAQAVRCLNRRRYTSMYWIAILLIFAGPAVLDVLIGFGNAARLGFAAAYFGDAELGVLSAICFALVHVSVAIAVQQFRVRLPLRSTVLIHLNRVADWMLRSNAFRIALLVLFSGSCIAVFWVRGDLDRTWNDFLNHNISSEYYIYTYFASTPLAAVLISKWGLRHWMPLLVCSLSIGVAYCFAIRYYMFPFVGFVCLTAVLRTRSSGIAKALRLVGLVVVAWVSLSLWGIIRDYNIRRSPLSLFEHIGTELLYDRLVAGNELATRLTYYELMHKLSSDHPTRGLEPVIDSTVDALYPTIRRTLDIPEPSSTSMAIYESVSNTKGSKVSFGATVFGCDWFNWGWSGAFIGGFIIGWLLRIIDNIERRFPALLLCAAPMLCYQMIFWARGGLDFTLGLWGRALPILVVLVIIVRLIEAAQGTHSGLAASSRCRAYIDASS